MLANEVSFKGKSLGDLLDELVEIETAVVTAVERSKARDDVRGASVIDDYAETHVPASEDSVVRSAKARLVDLRETAHKVKSSSGTKAQAALLEVLGTPVQV